MERAYSVIQKTAVDEEGRMISGIATTPKPDRYGDIVEPAGAVFKNPTPLLWQHNHSLPVGKVEFGTPNAKGIPFKARISKVSEPGTLKDRTDEAWHSVKEKLVTAVSIGFIADRNHSEPLPGGGVRFKKYELIELSLVTIPANSQAMIETVRSADQAVMPEISSKHISPREQRRLERMGRRGPRKSL